MQRRAQGTAPRATSHSAKSPERQPPSSSSDSTVDSKARSFVWLLMGSYAVVAATGSGAASRTSILAGDGGGDEGGPVLAQPVDCCGY